MPVTQLITTVGRSAGGGGGGGGGGGSLTSPTTVNTDPFGGVGPSWSFNGSTSGVTFDVNTYGMDPSGQDWCVEGFYYQTTTGSFPRLFSIGAYPSAAIAVSLEGTFYLWLNSSIATSTGQPSSNNWHHFAISRVGGGTTLYIDGNIAGTTGTNMPSISGQTLYLGVETSTPGIGTNFQGYINSFRWTVGNGVYTGSFVVPTSALGNTQPAGSNINEITSGQVKLLY